MEELRALAAGELDAREAKNTDNLKRLLAKKGRLRAQLAEMERELGFLRAQLDPGSGRLEEILYQDQVHGLLLRLEEVEARNIELENQCLLAPRRERGSLMDDIVNEFNQMTLLEKERNKKLGLYAKKGFTSSQEEDVERLRKEAEVLNKGVAAELRRVDELEQQEAELVQNVSMLQRAIDHAAPSGLRPATWPGG